MRSASAYIVHVATSSSTRRILQRLSGSIAGRLCIPGSNSTCRQARRGAGRETHKGRKAAWAARNYEQNGSEGALALNSGRKDTAVGSPVQAEPIKRLNGRAFWN